eukprot:Tbor_TRINITY_DN5570_c3_g3::TRINITY_DN5570_c3_g3_i2::g.13912::m.13912/K01489/cdd, CDA; cytidine deaminase
MSTLCKPLQATTPVTSLTLLYQTLVSSAITAQTTAYCPYSSFGVGAALLHKDNSITIGSNYENCTLQATCAERAAIVSANTNNKRQSVAIAVYGNYMDVSNNNNNNIKKKSIVSNECITCCGLCRQLLVEVAELSMCDLDIIMISYDRKSCNISKLSEMYPFGFGPRALGVDLAAWGRDRERL